MLNKLIGAVIAKNYYKVKIIKLQKIPLYDISVPEPQFFNSFESMKQYLFCVVWKIEIREQYSITPLTPLGVTVVGADSFNIFFYFVSSAVVNINIIYVNSGIVILKCLKLILKC